MNAVFSACFFAIFTVILLGISEHISPRFKAPMLAGAGILLFLIMLYYFAPVLKKLREIADYAAMGEGFSILWKGLGVSLAVSVTASFCRDLGEEGVASKLEMCGKGAVLSLTLPILEDVLDLIGEMLG